MEVIRKHSQPVTQWSGGETRQLYIFPKESSLQNRDFFFRISTATITVEKSTFTPIPNYFRVLMVLDGELKLIHKGQHSILLKKFDTDEFLGEWETTCYGTGIDFNLISTEQYACIAYAYIKWDEEPVTLNFSSFLTGIFMYGLYVVDGEITITENGNSFTIETGDLVCFDANDLSEKTISIHPKPNTVAIDFTIERLYD